MTLAPRLAVEDPDPSQLIRVGNAPVSFGVFEPEFGETKQLPWPRVLDMIVEAGYAGTELGPYGYLPTEPQRLSEELRQRDLVLGSSFVPVDLASAAALDAAEQTVLKVGRLLHTQGVEEVIVADLGDEARRAAAGCVTSGWSEAQWGQVARSLLRLAAALERELRMRIVIHHHAGTYLETPQEIERLLLITEPGRVDLLLDTGHYVYGGGDPIALVREHGARVRYLHYKDIDDAKLATIRREHTHMQAAWRQGVFVPLGEGCVDFTTLTDLLRQQGYAGWIIVEQDTIADDQGNLSPDPLQCARRSREYLRKLGL
jgi:inosose dehydratase